MALTELAARKAKARENAYKLADGGGLHLLVQPNGSKLWRLKYRFGNKEKLLSFGPYPLITIAKAREKRDEAKRLLLEGVDPGVKKKLDKIASETSARQTFGLIADEYLDRMKDRGAAASTLAKTTWLLKDLAKPLEDRPVKEIVPAELLDLLQRIEKSGRRETARIVAMRKVAEPVGQSRSDFDIFCALAQKMGVGEQFSEGLDEMGWLKRLYADGQKHAERDGINLPAFDEFWEKGYFHRPHSLLHRTALSEFRADPVKNRLRTRSGKIEVYCQALEAMGLADCPAHPTWLEPHEWQGSDLVGDYPLHLLSPQPRHRLHGQLDGNGASAAAKVNGREAMYLSPNQAAKRDLSDGDIARVFNGRGSVLCGVCITDDLADGVVLIETGAWYSPGSTEGVSCDHGNPNVLTADRRTSSLSCGCAANSALVEVERFSGEAGPVKVHRPPALQRQVSGREVATPNH